jgi:predicted transcriptional regulator
LLASHVEGKRRYLEITEKGRRVLAALDELRELI